MVCGVSGGMAMERMASLSPYFGFQAIQNGTEGRAVRAGGLHEFHQHDLAAIIGEVLPLAGGIDQAEAGGAAERARLPKAARQGAEQKARTSLFMIDFTLTISSMRFFVGRARHAVLGDDGGDVARRASRRRRGSARRCLGRHGVAEDVRHFGGGALLDGDLVAGWPA